MSGRQSGKHNKCKTLRANSYLNKVKSPPCILTDVINLEINDLPVPKNFASRDFFQDSTENEWAGAYILSVLTVGVRVDIFSGAAQEDNLSPA